MLVFPCLSIANTPSATEKINKMNNTAINFNFWLLSYAYDVFFAIFTTFFFLSNSFLENMVSRLMFFIIGDASDFFRLASKQKKSTVFHSAFSPYFVQFGYLCTR